MPTACEINFEHNPQKIVYCGEKIYVTVRLRLTEEIKVRSIDFYLNGTAHVRFFKDDSNRDGYHTERENVLDIRKCLAGGNGKGETQIIPVGTHDYNFTCTLPSNLPEEFFGTYGNIKYTANVALRIPFWPDKKFQRAFHVFKRFDLNDDPLLRAEVSDKKLHTISPNAQSGSTEEGVICISAKIPIGGYAYGQSIPISGVEVENTSDYPISKFSIYILRKITYIKSDNCRKTEYETVQKRNAGNWICGKQAYKRFSTVSIKVPTEIAPTDTETCNIIKISYLLSIESIVRDVRKSSGVSISLDLPITIGNYPLTPILMGSYPNKTNMVFARITRTGSGCIVLTNNVGLSGGTMQTTAEVFPLESELPTFPDDDTVSIRTYTSTPPPFPDDDSGLPTYEEARLLLEETNIYEESIEATLSALDT
ncbi:arrestin domain-containing protein 2-like [Bradysia coprophila]|uniref:arrestin domain-containing protein 2-like n=1 Tax=Bradysia coprophila TaxID=38358 RepID=UPI00187D8CE2|nr:arrestin domain-containing protein 2-like [Bradysia coprophila]